MGRRRNFKSSQYTARGRYCSDCGLGAGSFPKDDWALADFDGTPLYEYSDPQQGNTRIGGLRCSIMAGRKFAIS